MRGLWVSYLTLDMQNTDMSFNSFKDKFDKIIKEAKDIKCNALIVQVRPFSDALYNSKIFPYSHILTGTQGKDPEYDPLEYMCKTSKENSIELHTWINPLRISNNSSNFELSKNNIYIKYRELTFETESGIYLNPAIKETRKIIADGVLEIIENYDIDGIHFDDYFYPADIENQDADFYNTYKKSIANSGSLMSLEEWRVNNINLLIAEVYKTIKSADENVVFGISPQGNLSNNKTLYADPETWCKSAGYIDYICPQLYFSLDNPALTFEKALDDWNNLEKHKDLKVYIGLAVYKAGSEADDGTWLKCDTTLKNELILLRNQGLDGYMLYEYSFLNKAQTEKEMNNLSDII